MSENDPTVLWVFLTCAFVAVILVASNAFEYCCKGKPEKACRPKPATKSKIKPELRPIEPEGPIQALFYLPGVTPESGGLLEAPTFKDVYLELLKALTELTHGRLVFPPQVFEDPDRAIHLFVNNRGLILLMCPANSHPLVLSKRKVNHTPEEFQDLATSVLGVTRTSLVGWASSPMNNLRAGSARLVLYADPPSTPEVYETESEEERA